MAKIIVTGYMIRHPLAGNMLAYFQYLLGFKRLGHDVVYLEESGWPGSCYDPLAQCYSDDPRAGIRRVKELFQTYNAGIPAYYVNRETGEAVGISRRRLEGLLADADLLLNLGGVCALPEFQLVERRAFLDMDPLFTQAGRFAVGELGDYHTHFSYGTNIGRTGCSIPTLGFDWLPAVPPVVPGIWSDSFLDVDGAEDMAVEHRPLTTVANWSAYGGMVFAGEAYGQKDEEFLRFVDLPNHTDQPLELAVSGADGDARERMKAAGWSIRDAGDVSVDVARYREYIFRSRGEFSVAKHAYVKTRSGWFSDRSVCYLAAGRPVIIQDTGIGSWLPVGEGVLVFSTLNQAAESIASVNASYSAQRATAAALARDIFSYRVVLPGLLDRALGSVSPTNTTSEAAG